MYQVLARKFRPRNFDELVGQGHVTRTLSNAIQSGRLAHAYLFAGQRGTGKTTVARIVAKCLNCERGPVVKPCDACVACEEIAASRSMDVFEIDAASRTKVEQTRELLEMVSYAPVRDRNKIIIIDEVHMLSSASFNALLKTLEEPPPNVVFILATTEIQKILSTILSRCQVFEFRRVGVQELLQHLRNICDQEKIEASDQALERIARAGDGSVRDALSVLERVLAFCGEQIDDDEVLRMLGGVRSEVLQELFRALDGRDTGAMLGVLDGVVDEGHDLLHFWHELIAALRDLLLARAVSDRPEILSRSTDEMTALQAAAAGLSSEDLTRCFQIVADLEPALKSSSQPRFMFESALIRLGQLGAVRPIEELMRVLGPRAAASSPAQKKNATDEAAPPARAAQPASADLTTRLVTELRRSRPMLGAILDEASVVADGRSVRIELPAGRDALLAQLQRKENLQVLQHHARQLVGTEATVAVALAEPATAPVAAPTPDPPPVRLPRRRAAGRRPAGSTTPPEHGSLIERAKREPGVKKLLKEFGAQVVDIGPLDPPAARTGQDESDALEDTP